MVLIKNVRVSLEKRLDEIYELWYRRQAKVYSGQRIKHDEAKLILLCAQRIDELTPLAEARRRTLKALERRAGRLKDSVARAAGAAGFEMIEISGQRYWEPANPVVLMSGLNLDFSHGRDGRFSQDGLLPLRGRTIGRLTLKKEAGLAPEDVTLAAGEILTDDRLLPPVGRLLVQEAALLSPDFTESLVRGLARRLGQTGPEVEGRLTEVVAQLQAAMVLPALVPELTTGDCGPAAGFDAAFPDKNGVEHWQAPWFPLLMMWQAEYHSDPLVAAEKPGLANWRPTGDGLDFSPRPNYADDDVAQVTLPPLTLEGESLITPHAALELSGQARELLAGTLDTENLKILSQSLGVFHDQLLLRRPGLQFPIFDWPGGRGDPELARRVSLTLGDHRPPEPYFDSLYAPLRAGKLVLKGLSLIDSFGQFQALPVELGQAVAESLRPPDRGPAQKVVVLPPRLSAPARLKFVWAGGPAQAVRGWLMLNRLDSGLSVFDAEGRHLGGLQRVMVGPQPVVWKKPPEEGGGSAALPEKIDPDLGQFLAAILDRSRRGEDILSEMLDRLDDSLGGVNPLSASANEALGQLLGRPLALVRASLALELFGPAPAYKRLDFTSRARGLYPRVDLTAAGLGVRLGRADSHHDGLMGFFLDGDYGRLHLAKPGPAGERLSDYFSLDNQVVLSPAWLGPARPLTLLLDPAGEVTLLSGVLPVKTSRLEESLVAESLGRLYHSILTAPVLQTPDLFQISAPEVEGRSWSWLGFNESGGFEEIMETGKPDGRAVFPGRPITAREGWLKLR